MVDGFARGEGSWNMASSLGSYRGDKATMKQGWRTWAERNHGGSGLNQNQGCRWLRPDAPARRAGEENG
jgi:hypothetical protein